MSDDNEQDEVEQQKTEEEKSHTIKQAKKPKQQGTKNERGDYVVTSIDIPDMRSGIKKDEHGNEVANDSDSDTEYDDEDDQKESTPVVVEEVKPAKKLSKKEQKALEDAEFEALMAGVVLTNNETADN